MPDAVLRWSATESAPIEPFRVSGEALGESKMRINPSMDFQSENVFIADDDFWESFAPELQLRLDLEELHDSTGLTPDDATLVVVVRDRELNKFLRIDEWLAIAVPAEPVDISHHLAQFSNTERMDVCLLVSPNSASIEGAGIAKRRGQVVARKVFQIRRSTKSTKVPTRWVKPEDFVALDLPPDTIWFIKWKGEDFDRPPHELIEIWVNEGENGELKEKYRVLEGGGPSAKIFLYDMAASILAEMAIPVLSSEQEEPFEPNSMREMISMELTRTSGLDFADLRGIERRHDGVSRIRALAQSLKGANKIFSEI